MSDIDYGLLSTGAGGDPPAGLHTAMLARAALVDTSKGSMLVSEWQVIGPPSYYWTVWHGFTAERMTWTQDYLDDLGVDRAKTLDDDSFEAELLRVQGQTYEVRVEQNGRFLNTYVEERVEHVQTRLDVPIDDADLPPARAYASERDDSIPF